MSVSRDAPPDKRRRGVTSAQLLAAAERCEKNGEVVLLRMSGGPNVYVDERVLRVYAALVEISERNHKATP